MDAIFKFYPEFAKSKSLIPGNCSLHNDVTIHRAGDSITNCFRRAMAYAYIPDGANFNGIQNILSDKLSAKSNMADLLRDDQQTALIFSKALILS